MGLSLEFYAGDRDSIIEAIRECDLDRLDDPEVSSAYADLSLHLEPRDLDLLSRAIGLAAGREGIELGPQLTAVVDEEGYGALEVGREWVQYVASADMSLTEDIAQRWVEAMSAQYAEPLQVNEDIRNSISELLSLCRKASTINATVVHVWYL